MARVITVRSFAKINLSLKVRGPHVNGYHELQTVFQTIGLADTLTFRVVEGPFRLSCTCDDVPIDERNLVWRAAAALWAAAGRAGSPTGVSVAIRKSIPPQSGLGGGSANAAATLLALPKLWRVRVPAHTIDEIGAALGADVPFFLCGGTALGLGRGDQIYPLADIPRSAVVIVCPPFGVSTAEAFGWFDAEHGARPSACRTEEAPGPLQVVWRCDASHLVNDLEPCVRRRHPVIGELSRRLLASGARAAAMSGSGSAVFGLFSDPSRAVRAAARLAREGWLALATRTLTRREYAARSRPTETRRPRS